jgi:hypothetical protein
MFCQQINPIVRMAFIYGSWWCKPSMLMKYEPITIKLKKAAVLGLSRVYPISL